MNIKNTTKKNEKRASQLKISNILKIFLVITILTALVSVSTTKTLADIGNMELLTVSGKEHQIGGVAQLELEVKPGTGRVFIDSFPLSKLDTQISTRFANQIACDFLKKDCTRYDFFYTLRAKASILGGPSAGAAMTILTIGVLGDLKLDKSTIITGTINSGNLIGPVAGLEPKIDAAIDNGYRKVIIPGWQSELNVSKMKHKDFESKIKVIRTTNIYDALYEFTGKNFSVEGKKIVVPKEYSTKMNAVANNLCDRAYGLREQIDEENANPRLLNISDTFINRSKDADLYSKASYCFSANLRLKEILFHELNLTQRTQIYDQLVVDLSSFKEELKTKELNTLSDLESYIIVSERMDEAEEYLSQINKNNVSDNNSIGLLAYAEERFASAITWSEFFGMSGKNIELDENHLRDVCLRKSAEAEERVSYVDFYIPGIVDKIKKDLETTYQYQKNKEYALCIFKASKAKAEANVLLTAITIKQDEMNQVVLEKISSIENVLDEQRRKGIFPIIGYSYYEYAKSLVNYDVLSALTFSEYSLELSRLDLYFPKKSRFNFTIEFGILKIFFFGLVIGGAIIWLFFLSKEQKRKFKNPERFQEYRNLPGKKR